MPAQDHRQGFSEIELFLIGLIVSTTGVLVPLAIQDARDAAVRVRCQNSLKQIDLAFHHYHARDFDTAHAVEGDESGNNQPAADRDRQLVGEK